MNDQILDACGPLLVYDKKFRNFELLDEDKIRKALSKLVLILRSAGVDDITGILQYLLRADANVLKTANNLLLPRIVEYIQPHFHTENFRNFRFLGGGGFGTVFKAKHKIDGQCYAIKVVSDIRSLGDLERASSEVGIMARLKHENIINYVTSWVEYGRDEEVDKINQQLTDYDSYSSLQSRGPLLEECSSGGSGDPSSTNAADTDALSNTTSSSQKHSSRVFSLCGRTSSSSPSSRDTSQIDMDVAHKPGDPQACIKPECQLATFRPETGLRRLQRRLFVPRLFIQMELCSYNLSQWLQHRNAQVFDWSLSRTPGLPDWLETVPHSPARWLADQLACGVAYLHANDMMHRDLKPENVLISGPPLSALSDRPCFCQPGRPTAPSENVTTDASTPGECYHRLTVKICDFGLARILNHPYHRGLPTLPPAPGSVQNSTLGKSEATSSLDIARSLSNRDSRSSSSRCHSVSVKRRSRSHGVILPVSCRVSRSGSPSTAVVADRHSEIPSASGQDSAPVSSESPYLLTGHLGSELYAAPEVRPVTNYKRRLLYDYKADVYSMGVIFLQLFYPFSTLHELIVCLQSIANSNPADPSGRPSRPRTTTAADSSPVQTELDAFPRSFLLSWPEESRLVGRMLSSDPARRPNAVELQSFLASTSELPHLVQQQPLRPSTPRVNTSSSRRPVSAIQLDRGQAALDLQNNNNDVSAAPWQLQHNSPCLVSAGGTNRVLDWLLWRNWQLERELVQVRQRLRRYESTAPEP